MGKYVCALCDLLTSAECQKLLSDAEEKGFRAAHQYGRVPDEVFIEDVLFADELRRRLQGQCPIVEVDSRFEFYRYRIGDGMRSHTDGGRPIRGGLESNGTLLIYLCEGLLGGSTSFPETNTSIEPAFGSAVVFSHDVVHRGEIVLSGTKYILRLDIALSS